MFGNYIQKLNQVKSRAAKKGIMDFMKVEEWDEILIKRPVCAIYLERDAAGLCAGIAVFERYGAAGWVHEVHSDAAHPYGALDKLLHLIFVSGASDLLVGASQKSIYEEVAGYFEPLTLHYSAETFDAEMQNLLFQDVFELRSLLTPLEHFSLEQRGLGAMALAHLVSAYRGSSLRPIASPAILDAAGLLEVGNNALEQLQIASADPHAPTVARLIHSMHTPMGQRLGRFWLFLPITDKTELVRRYDWIEWVFPHTGYLSERLRMIGDIQMQWRQLCRSDADSSETEAFVRVLASVEEMYVYCRRHKPALVQEWDEALQMWIDECRVRVNDPLWVSRQVHEIAKVIGWIARLDVAVAAARTAHRLGLCRPVIIETAQEDNFVQIMGLRHLLVEQQGVAYVPNDIVMGNRDYLDLPYPSTVMLDPRVHDGAHIRGVMLYGINSSGKSSLMKSLGIAVVLAQAGFYVPAQAMTFSLLEGIYTRIVSHDKVARSLSTFGVEMLELNAIFAHAGAKTLILGDEISHGTETLSAVAIVASTVMQLTRKGALFMLTTHLHQLSQVKELSVLREVVSLHLSVRYDEETDRLVYDRRLQAGRGSSIYGLEFARSLHMDASFLEDARRLRDQLAKEYDVLELAHQKEYLKRYRDVSACECVICGALIRNPLKAAPSKEHHNLIPVCEKDRRSISEGKIKPRGFIMTPQGLRLEYETQL